MIPMSDSKVNREYKDRLFKFIFGHPDNKEWTLSLYNAMNGSHYTEPDDLTFNTIEDAVYMGMKNDVSFTLPTPSISTSISPHSTPICR